MEAQAVLGSFVAGQEDYEVLEEIGQGTFSEVCRLIVFTAHGRCSRAVLGSFVAGQEDYEVLEEIGQGTFSEVHRGRHRSTHQEVALKEMFLTEQKALPLHVERELQLLRAVSHPNILPLQGVYSKGFGITLVFPLCRTDLYRAMDAGPLPAPIAKAALKQLFEAVGALHDAAAVVAPPLQGGYVRGTVRRPVETCRSDDPPVNGDPGGPLG
ncbi:Cyclin-dependent kinase 1 [Auxenochlorella protothecoides]|uniref:Cyclin-dependent kinase 1 n=1 Tax=Auxenochlorella protothecoides TaxID=3075 RepID=A0A087SFJ6_AUXPR|nr:Cyclin-dependent kinase 1 [Auxenochlorella protothecoides]KFM24500.1 Cyclin-dependent kinase 1 [Auxenochlorella protothecoides]